MLVKELFQQLAFREFKNLSLVDESTGTIKESEIPRLVSMCNDSLLIVFTRFPAKISEVTVETRDHVNIYNLRKEHSVLNGTDGYDRYIIDTPSYPFTGNVISILSVMNEVGMELPLNDPSHYASVFTPEQDVVQFNHPGYRQVFSVNYQAAHDLLKFEGLSTEEMLNQVISIPLLLREPLRIMLAQMVFSSMLGQEYSSMASTLLGLYEAKCSDLELRNAASDMGKFVNNKLRHRGFP